MHISDGDGTVPLLSLGLMCRGGWREAGHLNPGAMRVVGAGRVGAGWVRVGRGGATTCQEHWPQAPRQGRRPFGACGWSDVFGFRASGTVPPLSCCCLPAAAAAVACAQVTREYKHKAVSMLQDARWAAFVDRRLMAALSARTPTCKPCAHPMMTPFAVTRDPLRLPSRLPLALVVQGRPRCRRAHRHPGQRRSAAGCDHGGGGPGG